MVCATCPLCTDGPCGLYEDHAIDDKDGYCRCNVPWNNIHKLDMEYGDYLGEMGLDTGIEMVCEQKRIDKTKIIKECKHMIGLDHKKPYYRHGKAFYRPYRNYYEAPEGGNKYLDTLPQDCITRTEYDGSGTYSKRPSVWYKLTRTGLDWLGRCLNVTIYDEMD